jgi:hypothetical protein
MHKCVGTIVCIMTLYVSWWYVLHKRLDMLQTVVEPTQYAYNVLISFIIYEYDMNLYELLGRCFNV